MYTPYDSNAHPCYSTPHSCAAATETDDTHGQHCRTCAKDVIPTLISMLRTAAASPRAMDEPMLVAVLACLRFVTKGIKANIELATVHGACVATRDVMVSVESFCASFWQRFLRLCNSV